MASALLRQRVTARVPAAGLLENAAKQARDLAELLARTIEHAESNSQLITGPRGSGKTAIVETALQTLRERYAGQDGRAYLVVQLDGLVLTDDRAALQEIAWQLAVEQQLEQRSFGSFAETLAFLLTTLRTGDARTTTPIVFVLNEFDQFALHPKQTLLYNLFDIVQSQSSPIAVVAVTCRLDAVELLEKRVKSRFSHRSMDVRPLLSLGSCLDLLERTLTLPESAASARFVKRFNDSVAKLRHSDDYVAVVRGVFELGRDVSALMRLAYLVVAALGSDEPALPNPAHFQTAAATLTPDPKVQALVGASLLELSLVIAMGRLVDKREQTAFNFEMAYDEYRAFMAKNTSVTVELYSKPVALKAYERLLVCELVRPVGSGAAAAGGGHREFALVSLQVVNAQIEAAINRRTDCPVFIKRWATQWTE